MKKIQSYLGILLALILLTGFFPVGKNPHFPFAEKITFLDHTAFSRIALDQIELRYFWLTITEHLKQCTPSEYSTPANLNWCVSFSRHVYQMPTDLKERLFRSQPSLKGALDEEEEINAQPATKASSIQRESINLRIGKIIVDFLEEEKSGLAVATYFSHAMLLCVATLIVVFRGFWGQIIIAPASFLVKTLKKLWGILGGIHDKI